MLGSLGAEQKAAMRGPMLQQVLLNFNDPLGRVRS